MLTFEEAMQRNCAGWDSSYADEAMKAMWAGLQLVKPKTNWVEIGCEFGHSTGLIVQMAQELNCNFIAVDPFLTYVDERNVAGDFMTAMRRINLPFTLMMMKSDQAASHIPAELGFVHIDGDHSMDFLSYDCGAYLPRLMSGGIAAFHDYANIGTFHVQPCVDMFTKRWERVALGRSCLVLRKP